MERDKMKTDLSALFMPRQPPMPMEEAVSSYIFSNINGLPYIFMPHLR